MEKINAVEKPTTSAEAQAPQHRQVNDPGSLSKPEKLGAAGRRRAVLAVCAVYSGPDRTHLAECSALGCGLGWELEFGILGRKTDARFAVLIGTGTVGAVGNGHTLICLVATYPLSCE